MDIPYDECWEPDSRIPLYGFEKKIKSGSHKLRRWHRRKLNADTWHVNFATELTGMTEYWVSEALKLVSKGHINIKCVRRKFKTPPGGGHAIAALPH